MRFAIKQPTPKHSSKGLKSTSEELPQIQPMAVRGEATHYFSDPTPETPIQEGPSCPFSAEQTFLGSVFLKVLGEAAACRASLALARATDGEEHTPIRLFFKFLQSPTSPKPHKSSSVPAYHSFPLPSPPPQAGIQQQFQMNRKQLLSASISLEGRLEKKSTNFLVGFQEREWKILEGGSRIGYRKPGEEQFQEEKVWKVGEVRTEEVEDQCCFLLHTPRRTYELRAESAEVRKQWMRAIEALKRESRKNSKPVKGGNAFLPGNLSPYPSPDSTLPSIDPFHTLNMTSSVLNQTGSGLNQTLPPRFTSVTASKLASSFYGSKSFPQDELKQKFSDLLKKLPVPYTTYHVLVAKLTTRSKDFLSSSNTPHFYILFSSKSLFPQEWISEENLTSAHLPHWADPDALYRIDGLEGRMVVKMDAVTEIAEADSSSALTIATLKERLQFYCQSLSARKRIKECFQIGRINALQTISNNGSRRNYDAMILLHGCNLQEFNAKVTSMLGSIMSSEHNYQLDVVKKLVDNLSPLIVEVVGTLQRKVTIPTAVIVEFLRILHEEVRRHLKLAWDSNAGKAKGGEILNILKSISTYESLVNRYVKDSELEDAMKELSKMYMRACFRNFQTIILGIVMQERKDNYFRIEESEVEGGVGLSQGHLVTHGVTDLFKFIYDVFQLAIPCWNNRLHLHNINRLVRRALSVFVRQLRATVDQEDISANELIAISNNYVSFQQQVEEFYNSRLSELKEETKKGYDELKDEYREVAMIVVDKLTLPLKIQLKIYFQKQTLYSAAMEEAFKRITESGVKEYARNAHFILRKRYFQRVFGTLREEICRMAQKQAKKIAKKKPDLAKLLERLDIYRKDCIEMALLLCGSKLNLVREFQELRILLTTSKREEMRTILTESSQFYKRVYKNLLNFRADYSQGSALYVYISGLQSEPESRLPQEEQDRRRSSFSKYYIQEMERNSVTSSIEKPDRERSESGEEKLRMISEGFVKRVRQASGNYQEIFLKLKKSVLYIYQNERMERCQNTVQIQAIEQVSVPNPDKPVFIISFSALHRTKEMRMKCSSVEESSRWVYTLQLELRRISNDRRMKKGVKIREKKSKLVIDYEELNAGTDYFSYNA